jgi:hypothetical protein
MINSSEYAKATLERWVAAIAFGWFKLL